MSEYEGGEQTAFEAMQSLYKEIYELAETQSETAGKRIREIVQESSKLEEKSTTPVEKIIDAKILHVGAKYVNSNVKSLITTFTSFNESEYTKGILSYLVNPSVDLGWNSFGPVTYPMFKKSHPLTFKLGTLTLEPPPVKEKRKVERLKKATATEKVVLATVTDTGRPQEEENSVYDHILSCLTTCYKKNGRNPVSYFKFIMDPNSYGRTVENIFYFAFLVHDGWVKMFIKNNHPFVVPILRKRGDNTDGNEVNFHFCFSLCMNEWEECLKKFEIRHACIPPFVKKT